MSEADAKECGDALGAPGDNRPVQSGWYIATRKDWSEFTPAVVVRVDAGLESNVTTVWQIGRRDPSTLNEWRLRSKIRGDGQVTDVHLDAAQKEAWADGRKAGRAEVEKYRAELTSRTVNVGFAEVDEPVLILRIPLERARDLQSGLADLLCWVRGFKAGCPDERDRHPMGAEEGRAISLALQGGIAKVRGVPETPIF